LFFARSAKKLDSLDFSLPCRAANDFTVSHETNSLPGNKMYVARLKKFSLQKCKIGQKKRNKMLFIKEELSDTAG
jgi:hypothetical protein